MKPLTKQQLAGLVRMVGETRERELNCTECQRLVGEFAERELAGLPLGAALEKVQQHLVLCPECREELLALRKVLESGCGERA